MDMMSLIDLLFVGAPETILTLLTVILVFEKNSLFTRKRISKILISTIGVLTTIYYTRLNINDITIIACISTLAYILAFKLVFTFNWHKSIIMGLLSIYMIMTIEFLSYSSYGIIDSYASGGFFINRIFYSIPSRVIQLLLLLLIVKFQLYMKNFHLLETKWSELTSENKTTLLTLIIHIFVCLVFNLSYSDMFIKIQVNKPNIDYLDINLKIYLIQTIFLSLNTILLFTRTFNYEQSKRLNIEYKNLIDKYENILIKNNVYNNET